MVKAELSRLEVATSDPDSSIVCVFVDRNYFFPTLVMLCSAMEVFSAKTLFVIGTFEGEVREIDRNNFQRFAQKLGINLELVEISKQSLVNEIGAIDENQHFGYAAFGRLFLQRLIRKKHLYTDVDVLFRGNPQSLWEALPDSRQVGFVSQAEAFTVSGITVAADNSEFFAGLISWPDLEFRPDLSVDSQKEWRTPHSSHDQALLNMRIGKSYLKLNPLLCQLDNPERDLDQYHDGILHYFGNWKPWQATQSVRERCFDEHCSWVIWFDYEAQAIEVLNSIGLGEWFSSLQKTALSGAPKNLRRLSKVLSFAKLSGTLRVCLLFLRGMWPGSRHLIH